MMTGSFKKWFNALAIAVLGAAVLPAFSARACAEEGAGGGKVARIFIVSGQSNAGGKGIGSDLPEELKKSDPEVLMFGRHVRGIKPMGPYKRNGYGKDNSAFGPDLMFAKEMKKAYPNDIICITKQTKGGTSIIAWDKDWKRADFLTDLKLADNVEKGEQYPALMDAITGAAAALKKLKGIDHVEYDAMLWIQSERDDHNAKTAALYEQNLRKLIANVRGDLGLPNLPFLFADANAHRNAKVMQDGMRKVAQEVPHTAVVSIAGLSKNGAVHYDTKGQIELGRRFAEAYLKMVGKEISTEPGKETDMAPAAAESK